MLNLKTFESLKYPVFRLYYAGMLAHMTAINMQLVARSLLVYRLTGSAAILGILSLGHAIPMVICSLFGGVVADRIPKKHILLAGQSVTAIASLGIALSLNFGYLSAERPGSWWILMVSAIIHGIIMGMSMPSRETIIFEIVGAELVLNAVSLCVLGMNALRILTPAMSGFIVDLFSFEAVYYCAAILYLISVVFIALMPVTGTKNVLKNGAFTDLRDGLAYIRSEPTIFMILGFTLAMVVLSRPYLFLMPIITEDILNVGAIGLGIMLSVSGAGAMLGSTVLASLPNKKRGLMFLTCSLVLGLALILFAFSERWAFSLTFIAVIGLADTGRMALSNALIQYYVIDEYRGRVMSILSMEFGLMSFGIFFAGILAENMGIQWSIGGLAMALVLLSLVVLCFSRRLRAID